MTQLAVISKSTKLALRDKGLAEVTQTLLGSIPLADGSEDFPPLPTPLTATTQIRAAMKVLTTTFNKVVVTDRRTLATEEIASIGAEYEAIQEVAKLLTKREEQIKEIIRTHQDVEAEEKGHAFPRDVVVNGNVVAKATKRDAKGHYLMATKGHPTETEVPGMTKKFSAQYTSGRTTENLGEITRMFQDGEISEADYKAMTVVKRVPDADKIRSYVLRTGDASILGKIVKKGLDSTSMCFRALTKK